MEPSERPTMHLRLRGGSVRDGEIALSELARLAEETQTLVRRLARGLVGNRGPGRAPAAIERATELTLIGLHSGSTILEIAGPPEIGDPLDLGNAPLDLGDRALAMVVDGLSAVASEADELPLGYDAAAAHDLDEWLKALRIYDDVEVGADIRGLVSGATIRPTEARAAVRALRPQPAMPYVSRTEQALEGNLYALNLRTGTYSIKDDSLHTIRLSLPQEIREEAAYLINRRVRAIGQPEVDQGGRLAAFTVHSLSPAADHLVLHEQGKFFERHELESRAPVKDEMLDQWAIGDIDDGEAEAFLAALRS